MAGLLKRLDAFGRVVENIVLAALLSGMMLVAVGQIVLREFFDTGFVWGDELVRLAVLWLALVGSVAACRDKRHIRIDLLSPLLPEKAVKLARILVDLFAALVALVIAWHAWRYLGLEIEYGDTVLVATPAWVAHSIVPLAFALIAYRFVIGALSSAGERSR